MKEFHFIEEAPIEGLARSAARGITIGRADCDIELNDPDVSRRHAEIHQVDDELAIEDLGSKNGTFVNERRVSGIVPIAPGDRIRFGNTVWRLAARSDVPPGGADQRAPAGDGVTD